MTRLQIDTFPGIGKPSHGGWLVDWSGGRVRLSRAQDNVFQLGIFHRQSFATTNPWERATLELKQMPNGEPPSATATAIASVIQVTPSTLPTFAQWRAGTGDHFEITLPLAATTALLAGLTPITLWAIIKITDVSNQRQLVACSGRIEFVDSL